MEFEERQNLYYRIVTGITVVEYDSNTYFIKDPSPIDHIKVNYQVDVLKQKLILRGVPSEMEYEGLLVERNLWNEAEESKLRVLKENLKKLQQGLPALEFKSTEKKQVLAYIHKTQFEIDRLNRIKNSVINYSLEYIIKLYKYKLFLKDLTTDFGGKPVWPTNESFASADDKLISDLLVKAYFSDYINESALRELARSEPWRSVWLGAVKTGNLFAKPVSELSDYQRALISWSILYDNVFDHPDCPSQDVIDNDTLLDSWLEVQSEKRRKDTGVAATLDSPHLRNSKEVFVVVDSPEDAKKVYDLNNTSAKQTIVSRDKSIKEKGVVKELDLPDVRRDFNIEVNRLGIQAVKNRG
jgi:hypothetical protein